MRVGITPYGSKSFVGNIPPSPERTKEIDKRLNEMVKNAHRPHTLTEIAKFCGMSKQAVYQIELRAIKKARKKLIEIYEEWK